MPTITRDQVKVPADVMPEARETYIENYMTQSQSIFLRLVLRAPLVFLLVSVVWLLSTLQIIQRSII